MIWLIGMMGSGKSTVGRALAARLGVPLWDSDDEVESSSGMTVRQLWETDGEAALRSAESQVVQRLAGEGMGIVATGGGVILDPANVSAMRSSGVVIWLRAEPAALAGRISGTARPLLDGADVEAKLSEILSTRHELYAAAAHATIDTDQMNVPDVVGAIEMTLP